MENRFLPSYAITDLGTLGGVVSHAYAINASGQVVGDSSLASGATHVFLYDGAAMNDLGALPGGDFSIAYGINNELGSRLRNKGLTPVG